MSYKIMHGLCLENLRHKLVERPLISEHGMRNHSDLDIPQVRIANA